jgi:hypothetical protein
MSMGIGRRIGAGAMVVSLAAAGVAVAAASPLRKGKAYDTAPGTSSRFALTLITSATDGTLLVAGPASPPLGSQYALSTGVVRCPDAPRNPGSPTSEAPFALFGFPGARLSLRHGKLGFAVTRSDPRQQVFGSTVKPFKLTIRIAGTVRSATKIAGTVTATGGPCTISHPLTWTATLNPQDTVAPGK